MQEKPVFQFPCPATGSAASRLNPGVDESKTQPRSRPAPPGMDEPGGNAVDFGAPAEEMSLAGRRPECP